MLKSSSSQAPLRKESCSSEVYGAAGVGAVRSPAKKGSGAAELLEVVVTPLSKCGHVKSMSTSASKKVIVSQKSKQKNDTSQKKNSKNKTSKEPSQATSSAVQESNRLVATQEPESYNGDPQIENSEINFTNEDGAEIYDKSFLQNSWSDRNATDKQQAQKKYDPTITNIKNSKNFVPQVENSLLNAIGQVFGKTQKQPESLEKPAKRKNSQYDFKNNYIQQNKLIRRKAQNNNDSTIQSNIQQNYFQNQKRQSMPVQPRLLTQPDQSDDYRQEKSSLADNFTRNNPEHIPMISVGETEREEPPQENKQRYGEELKQASDPQPVGLTHFKRKKHSVPVNDNLLQGSSKKQRLLKQEQRVKRMSVVMDNSSPYKSSSVSPEVVGQLPRVDESDNNSMQFKEQFYNHMNRKGKARLTNSIPIPKEKAVENAYFIKIPANLNQDILKTKFDHYSPVQQPKVTQGIGREYESPTFTPQRHTKVKSMTASLSGNNLLSNSPPKQLMQEQFLDGSQRLTQMETIMNIHENNFNDPKTIEKIVETNMKKFELSQKIKRLKDQRNNHFAKSHQSRSYSQSEQLMTIGYGTFSQIDNAQIIDQNPRDSSRLPQREELIDLKQFIASSPRISQNYTKVTNNRNDAKNRVSSLSNLPRGPGVYHSGQLNPLQLSIREEGQKGKLEMASPQNIYGQTAHMAASTRNMSPIGSQMSNMHARNSTISQSYTEVLQEYNIEGKKLGQLEKKLAVIEMQRQKAQKIVEQAKFESQLNQLNAAKNKLDKLDRLNHAKLVKDSIETESRLKAEQQKTESRKQKEVIMKKTFDQTMQARSQFKDNQEIRKQQIKENKAIQLSKNRQQMLKIKQEKVTQQIQNEQLKEERMQRAKDQRDMQAARKMMKEDLQATLEQEIRIHQQQLKELKDLKDLHLRGIDKHSSWNSQSTSNLLNQIHQAAHISQTPQTSRDMDQANVSLQKFDITKKEYFAPVKEINLYQVRQQANLERGNQKKSHSVNTSEINKREPAHLQMPFSNQNTWEQSIKKPQKQSAQLNSLAKNSPDPQLQNVQKTPIVKALPEQPERTQSPPKKNNKQITSGSMTSQLMQKSISSQQIVPVRQSRKNQESPKKPNLNTSKSSLHKSATVNALRTKSVQQQQKTTGLTNTNRLDKLRLKYDNQRHKYDNSTSKDTKLVENVSPQNNLGNNSSHDANLMDRDFSYRPLKVPPLKMKNDSVVSDSVLTQDNQNQRDGGSKQLSGPVLQDNSPLDNSSGHLRISKKLRQEIRDQSSTNSQGNRQIYLKDSQNTTQKYPKLSIQRCLSSQGTVEQPDFQPYVKLESVRVTPKHTDEILDPSVQISAKKARKQIKYDQNKQFDQLNQKAALGEAGVDSQDIYQHINAKKDKLVELCPEGAIVDMTGQSLYEGSSPSHYQRNRELHEEMEPTQSVGGYNISPDPNIHLQAPVDLEQTSDKMSFASSSRHFRSTKAISALINRQNKVSQTSQHIQELILQKQKSQQEQQQPDQEEAEQKQMTRQPSLIEKQMALRNHERKLSEHDQSNIKQKALDLIKLQQKQEQDIIKQSQPLQSALQEAEIQKEQSLMEAQSHQQKTRSAASKKQQPSSKAAYYRNKRKNLGLI